MERTLVDMVVARARTHATTPAARHKVDGAWADVSWPELVAQVRAVSNGLVALGVQPGDRVAVFAPTSVAWAVVDLAIAAARAVCVPIYPSNTPDEALFVLNDSGASVLFVDADISDGKHTGRLTRIRAVRANASSVRHVVTLSGAAGDDVISLDALVARGRQSDGFDARAAAIEPSDLCHFIYTSGTTGNPKGVMLSHGNWAFEAASVRNLDVMVNDDAVMLFLPLAHSFAQAVKAAWVAIGFTMVFAESVEKVVGNLSETRPTIFPAVPRLFEKVFAGVQSSATSAPGVKGQLGRWAFGQFDAYCEAHQAGRAYDSVQWRLAKVLVFRKVRTALDEKLGGRMRLFVSGGAPLSRKIGLFFEMLGITVCEGYGLTETSGPSTINVPGATKIGTVGRALPETEVAIAADGEVLLRGPHIMRGYHRHEAATAEVLTADGWFHSGDIGEIDGDGYVRITDRKKDIIVTAGGKNVAPQNLENLLKTFPLVSQSMVYGDKRPYLTVLLTVNEEVARKVVTDSGSAAPSTYAELAAHP
ncbi:MAG: long-chain fatty acid--CoA ligase, partial [Archangium sp.]|nr:long-chain fatty acid--CoA ligase [Archangium sp.]